MDDNRQGAVSATGAALIVGGAWLVSGLVSRRYSPDPTHPRLIGTPIRSGTSFTSSLVKPY